MIFGGSSKKIAELEEKIKQLEEENQRYKEALEFYASQKTWGEGHKYRDPDDATIFQDSATSAQVDGGIVAMKALKGG